MNPFEQFLKKVSKSGTSATILLLNRYNGQGLLRQNLDK